MRISRHYSSQHFNEENSHLFEARLALFEDRIRGWFHDQARILEKASDHAGFVLLLIAIGYVENYAIYWKGKDSDNHSKEFFRDAFRDIFPRELQPQNEQHQEFLNELDEETKRQILDEAADEIYRQVRCGLFHIGMTRKKVILSNKFDAVDAVANINPETGDFEIALIKINPHKMLNEIENHFSTYLMRLRNPQEEELRENFNRSWERIHG
jgi:hypothetical protein